MNRYFQNCPCWSTIATTMLLVGLGVQATAASAPYVTTINIDANLNRHPISPMIYGVNQSEQINETMLADLNVPLLRHGGNPDSRYNWQLNADNKGSDFYFESISEISPIAPPVPGAMVDQFVSQNRRVKAESMVTIPTIDWIAKLAPDGDKLWSFSVSKYGAQYAQDGDAGDGLLSENGPFITGNAPDDANTPNSPSFEQGLVHHLVQTWGNASNGGVKYYLLDNEPSIWYTTHRDVHPTGPTMDEIRAKMIGYARAVKYVDPAAKLVGPEEWGWDGYRYSGYDQQWAPAHNWQHPDRTKHGGMDYLPWLLDQLHQYEINHGTRLLDVFSLHYYPQGGPGHIFELSQDPNLPDDTSPAAQLLRNKSTRSLWDPNYIDVSWIGDKVMLIPRMKGWINSYYPGLQTAITEYRWGADKHINGGTAQADILGIFGREGLDFATLWATPDVDTYTYKAIKLYRNYDGNKSGFGDTSVAAVVANPDQLSAFAALRSTDQALTVMVINKLPDQPASVHLNLANYAASASASAWQLTDTNVITPLAKVSVVNNTLNTTVPAQSITLFVLGGAN